MPQLGKLTIDQELRLYEDLLGRKPPRRKLVKSQPATSCGAPEVGSQLPKLMVDFEQSL